MDRISTIFDKMKVYLTRLNYPNIEIYTSDDIIEIFSPQNRIKLLMWTLTLLSDAIAIPLEEDAQISYMADIVYQWGFCNLNEKIAFIKCEMEISEQFVIFSRIFGLLTANKQYSNKESTTTAAKEVDYEDLKNMIEYSNKLKKKIQKPISLKTHEDHRKEIMTAIDLLQSNLNILEKDEEFAIPILKDLKLEGFKDELATFTTNADIILSSVSNITMDLDRTLQLGNTESLSAAVSILDDTIKHVTNIKTVSEYKEMTSLNKPANDIDDKWCDRNFEILERMRQKLQLEQNSKIVQDTTKHLEPIND